MHDLGSSSLLTAILQRDHLKALTLTQPWASLVASGAKQRETRSWLTDYVGPLAIHAAKGSPPEAGVLCESEPFSRALEAAGYHQHAERTRNTYDLPLGAIIAIVWLEQVERITSHMLVTPQERAFGNYAPGRYAWRFGAVYPLRKPIPVRGALGLWSWQPPEEFWHDVQTVVDQMRMQAVAVPGRRPAAAKKPVRLMLGG